MQLRDYQLKAVDGIFEAFKTNQSTLLVLPTGCHRKGQGILMYDGTIKPVEDVIIGDELMGPNSKPKKVLHLVRNSGEMVEVCPIKGKSFVVNKDHILTLIKTRQRTKLRHPNEAGGTIIDVSIRDWMKWSKTQKHIHKIFRVSINFNSIKIRNNSKLDIDPYLLGIMVGDGSFHHCLAFTTMDEELKNEANNRLVKHNLFLSPTKIKCGKATHYSLNAIKRYERSRIKFRKLLKKMGLNSAVCATKFIPQIYKTLSKKLRLEILAGLMDTDGYATCGGFDYVTASEKLANDIVFVCRSVGLIAYMKPCKKRCQTGFIGTYYRISICGDTSIIPTRLKRKQTHVRRQKKNPLRTGFKIKDLNVVEPYYGFTLDGDGRYLLDDFTVTHNCGKTICFAEVINRITDGRVMVIAHREELIWQAADKIKKVTGEEVDIEMAEYHADQTHGMFGKKKVVVASVQTLIAGEGEGRISRFPKEEFTLLITDESQHSTSSSYKHISSYFMSNPNCRHLGVTATPDRADEEALGQIYGSVAYDYELTDAINDGWLLPIQQRYVTVEGLDLSQCRTTAGDLNGGDLAKVMEYEENLLKIAAPTFEISNGRTTLVFAASVAHAERLSEIFNRYESNCAQWVCGTTPKDERRQMFSDYSQGRFRFLINVGITVEGWDEPKVEVVVMGRPTKSRPLFSQMVGRGTRPYPPGLVDKYSTPEERKLAIANSPIPHLEIIDFVGNSGKHKLVSSADILGGNYSEEIVERAQRKARESKQPVNMMDTLSQAAKEAHAEELKAKELEAKRRAALTPKAKYSSFEISPFDILHLEPARARGWDIGKPISEKMDSFLQKQGINTDKLNYSEAKQIIGEIIGRRDKDQATFKQAKLLRRYNLPTNISFKTAKDWIDQIANNKWKVPENLISDSNSPELSGQKEEVMVF